MSNDLSDILNKTLPKIDFQSIELPKFDSFDPSIFEMPEIEPIPPELSKERIDYEDTVLKDFAKEIKAVQLETNKQLALLIEENRKSDLISRRYLKATLVIAALTLIATVVGIFV